MNQLKRKKIDKNLPLAKQIIIKWQNEYLKSIGYFEPIIYLGNLFKLNKKLRI